jgi:hypothetical protein
MQGCLRDDDAGPVDGRLMAPLKHAGVVDAAVAALQHESPFCVAAAAAALGWVGRTRGGGKACIQASGAIPALLRVIDRSPAPGNLETETGILQRYALKT